MHNNNLRVLVVDDELPLRETLRRFDWEACGCELAGEAENGEEALSFCLGDVPDILITDISMPIMDGLALVRAVKEKYPHMKVILLTCHTEFEYAQVALRLGAVDYLVKVTMQFNELETLLHKTRSLIEQDKRNKTHIEEEIRWNQSKIIRGWLTETPSPSILKKLIQHGVSSSQPIRFIRVVVSSKQENQLFIDKELQSLLIKQIHNHQLSFRWFPLDLCSYVLFIDGMHDEEDKLMSIVKSLLTGLRQGFNDNLSYVNEDIRLTAIISTPVSGPELVNEAFMETEKWRKNCFYDDKTDVFTGEAPQLRKLDDLLKKDLEALYKKSVLNRETLKEFVAVLFPAWVKETKIEAENLKMLILKWRNEWIRLLPIQADFEERTVQLVHAKTLTELIQFLLFEIESDGKNKSRSEIRMAQQYIQEHLSEPLTVSHVAEYVGFSADYLGRIFREDVGESFHDYVSKLRIDKAFDLLLHTNLKVYEVAERVGITSYRYFSILFRKRMGLSPTNVKKG